MMQIEQTQMPRQPDPDLPEPRREKVKALCAMVKEDIDKWDYAYKRMRNWRRFARGLQWPGMTESDLADPDRPYVANITMRHLKQRTASIYAKNPKYNWRRSKRLHFQVWDGTAQQLLLAQQIAGSAMDTGMYTQILMEAQEYQATSTAIGRVGDTLSGLYEYFVREQIPPAKKMMKKQVLASMTDGVSYFKQTFQRATQHSPDTTRALNDSMQQLARLERLSADLADDEIDPNGAEMEELRILIEQLESQPQIILREGLAIDYPDSANIIPDKNMTYLPGFVGCSHVTEQYCLTPDQIKEVYGIDVTTDYVQYRENETKAAQGGRVGETEKSTARVWEIWDHSDGMVYVVCDGYPDYLVEPYAPQTYTERFWPWFVYAPNAVEDPDDPFPPSDVELIMPMQMEINRSGQSLADHRYAARPGHVTGANIPDEDAARMENRKAHSIVVLKSLKPEERVQDKFQPFPASPIDPNLYNTGPAFTDILRSVGTQEANLGGTSSSTATESSIAEASRQSTLESAIDEFDDLLTEMARAGGQILLQEMAEETVKSIVGPGAVWPAQSRDEIAAEIHLEVVAGSSGRKNRAQEVQVRERLYPLLFQMPAISHEKMVRDLLRVMDDTINYEDWLDMSALPIMAMNGQMQANANRGEGGSDNAASPPEPSNEGPPRPGQDAPGATVSQMPFGRTAG